MGMNMHIIGLRPATEDYKKKMAAYYACKEAAIEIPDELDAYFNFEPPNPDGMEVDIDAEELDCVEDYNEQSKEGFTVEIAKLPAGVEFIRFYNSY